jgi:NAD+ kinase
LKFGIFVHPKRPKISVDKIAKNLRAANVQLCQQDPDIAIVVGGDGSFGYYGRILAIPMLFVGVHEPDLLGSKSVLAETFYDDLCKAVECLEDGNYKITERRMISVDVNGNSTDVLTDIYLERGIFSGCLRYTVSVDLRGNNKGNSNRSSSFTEFGIGNGVIASSSFGSGGYFSYIDRLNFEKGDSNNNFPHFSDKRIGICHILPVYLARKKENAKAIEKYNIRYTLPSNTTVRIKLVRNADVRLYGTTVDSHGIKVLLNDEIQITGSDRTAKIVKINNTIDGV